MHKGVILIVRAEDEDDAKYKVEDFMSEQVDHVCDYWSIGGRYSGMINPVFVRLFATPGYSELSKEEKARLWIEHGGQGPLPDNRDGPFPDDIQPLSVCLEAIRKYKGTEEEIAAQIQDMKDLAENSRKEGNKYQEGYYLKCAGHLLSEDFDMDTDVFNIEDYDYMIPMEEDAKDYFAVVIDMHN